VCLTHARIEIRDEKLVVDVVHNLENYKCVVYFLKSNLIRLLFNALNVSINDDRSIALANLLLQYSLDVVVDFNLIYVIYCIIVLRIITYRY